MVQLTHINHILSTSHHPVLPTDYYIPRNVNHILSTVNIATRRKHRGMTAITNPIRVAGSG